jgi:hypothetical protein
MPYEELIGSTIYKYIYILTFICLRGTTLSYDAHHTVRTRLTGFRVDLGTRYVTVCVAGRSGGKLSAVFLQPIQASMTLKSKGMLNTLNI